MIIAYITGGISIMVFILAIRSFQQKGTLLSNAYLFATPEQREKMDKKSEYRFVGIIMLSLSTLFLLLTISIAYRINWIFAVVILGSIALAVYAIVHDIRKQMKH